MSSEHLKHLLAKTKALFSLEGKLQNADKEKHQWQLYMNVGGLQFIVGKGGINTAFYKIGDEERQVCYPHELVTFLTKLAKRKHVAYAVYTKDKKCIFGPTLELETCLKFKKCKPGAFIVGINEHNKLLRLYYSSPGLHALQWLKFGE